jgi:hypothetical protein
MGLRRICLSIEKCTVNNVLTIDRPEAVGYKSLGGAGRLMAVMMPEHFFQQVYNHDSPY